MHLIRHGNPNQGRTRILHSDARLFCKNNSKIGSSTEKQAQHALARKFNIMKNQQENEIKSREANPKKQAQNEQIFT